MIHRDHRGFIVFPTVTKPQIPWSSTFDPNYINPNCIDICYPSTHIQGSSAVVIPPFAIALPIKHISKKKPHQQDRAQKDVV